MLLPSALVSHLKLLSSLFSLLHPLRHADIEPVWVRAPGSTIASCTQLHQPAVPKSLLEQSANGESDAGTMNIPLLPNLLMEREAKSDTMIPQLSSDSKRGVLSSTHSQLSVSAAITSHSSPYKLLIQVMSCLQSHTLFMKHQFWSPTIPTPTTHHHSCMLSHRPPSLV